MLLCIFGPIGLVPIATVVNISYTKSKRKIQMTCLYTIYSSKSER